MALFDAPVQNGLENVSLCSAFFQLISKSQMRTLKKFKSHFYSYAFICKQNKIHYLLYLWFHLFRSAVNLRVRGICTSCTPWTKYLKRHQTLNVGFSYTFTSIGTWRQEFICMRPPTLLGFCLGGNAILQVWNLFRYIVYNSCICMLSTQPSPSPPPPVTHCMNTYPCTYSHREGGRGGR